MSTGKVGPFGAWATPCPRCGRDLDTYADAVEHSCAPIPVQYELMPDAARPKLSCLDCGSVVWDRAVHDAWHKRQAEKERGTS